MFLRFVFPREHHQVLWLDAFLGVWIQQNRCHPTRPFPIHLFLSVLTFIPTLDQIAPLAWQKVIKLRRHQSDLTERKRLQCVPCRNARLLLSRSVNYFFSPSPLNCFSNTANAFSINVSSSSIQSATSATS